MKCSMVWYTYMLTKWTMPCEDRAKPVCMYSKWDMMIELPLSNCPEHHQRSSIYIRTHKLKPLMRTPPAAAPPKPAAPTELDATKKPLNRRRGIPLCAQRGKEALASRTILLDRSPTTDASTYKELRVQGIVVRRRRTEHVCSTPPSAERQQPLQTTAH